jgi:hypothetical protein
MTQKMRILAMVLLTLALMTAGIGGAVVAHAAPTPASLAWSPTTSSGTYDYGTLAAGATKSITFTLTNAGGKASGPLTITLSGPSAFTISSNGCNGRSLGPNKSCTVPVQYAPKSIGQSESATLTASGKAESSSLTLIGKAGVGVAHNLTLSPGAPTGNYNGTNSYGYYYTNATTFTVTNSGTSPSETLLILCGDEPNIESCPPSFMLNQGTCMNRSLAANGGSCTFNIGTPCQEGQVYPTVDVGFNDMGLPYITLYMTPQCP